MAILVRRGLRKDFNPAKMLAGEWAVSIDTDTNNQIVWMCFAPNVVKRMGTYEDFYNQILEATEDIRLKFKGDANEYIIQCQIEVSKANAEFLKAQTEANKAIDSSNKAKTSENNAKISEDKAKDSEDNAKQSENNATDYAELSKSWAVGDSTSGRVDEDIDNSKYYAQLAKNLEAGYEANLNEARALVEEASKKLADVTFILNPSNGHLYYNDESEFTFTIENGHLFYELG